MKIQLRPCRKLLGLSERVLIGREVANLVGIRKDLPQRARGGVALRGSGGGYVPDALKQINRAVEVSAIYQLACANEFGLDVFERVAQRTWVCLE